MTLRLVAYNSFERELKNVIFIFDMRCAVPLKICFKLSNLSRLNPCKQNCTNCTQITS